MPSHAPLQAYQRGEIRHTGVMVHLVPDEGVDGGPAAGAGGRLRSTPEDTLETLEARIHAVEHRLLVENAGAHHHLRDNP